MHSGVLIYRKRTLRCRDPRSRGIIDLSRPPPLHVYVIYSSTNVRRNYPDDAIASARGYRKMIVSVGTRVSPSLSARSMYSINNLQDSSWQIEIIHFFTQLRLYASIFKSLTIEIYLLYGITKKRENVI